MLKQFVFPSIKRFFSGVTGRLMTLFFLSLFIMQGLTLYFYEHDRINRAEDQTRFQIKNRIITVLKLLDETPPGLHQAIARSSSNARLIFRVASRPLPFEDEQIPRPLQRLEAKIKQELSARGPKTIQLGFLDDKHRRKHKSSRHDREEHLGIGMSITLQDPGVAPPRFLNIRLRFDAPILEWTEASLNAIGLTFIGVILLILLFTRTVTRPLKALNEQAQKIGMDENLPILEEAGPSEIKNTTAAFNRMSARLSRYLDNRRMMLMALSHDLKSPITALRLRNELVEDDALRHKIEKSLDDMENMVIGVMELCQSETNSNEAVSITLNPFIEDICMRYQEEGASILFKSEGGHTILAHPIDVKRVLTNLIENALRYGENAEITLYRQDHQVIVDIKDDGPGVPEGMEEQIFQPFFRVESSRNEHTGGYGLGLAIARNLILKAGGAIAMHNPSTGGAVFRVSWPIHP